MTLRQRIQAAFSRPDPYEPLQREAAQYLGAAVLLRDSNPCEHTGLLVAQAEMTVHLVEAARQGNREVVLALRGAIDGITRALDQPRPSSGWHARILDAAPFN